MLVRTFLSCAHYLGATGWETQALATIYRLLMPDSCIFTLGAALGLYVAVCYHDPVPQRDIKGYCDK